MAGEFRIFAIVGTAFKDVRRVVTALPLWSAYAALISLAGYTFVLTLQPNDLANVLSDLAVSFALVPFALAVYRFLLLGEIGLETDRDHRHRRLWELLKASVLVTLAGSILMTLAATGISLVVSILSAATTIGLLVLITTWFPAIAVDDETPDFVREARVVYPLFFRLLGAFTLVFIMTIIPMIAVISFLPFMEAFVGSVFTFVMSTAYLSVSAQTLRWSREQCPRNTLTVDASDETV